VASAIGDENVDAANVTVVPVLVVATVAGPLNVVQADPA